MKKFLIAASTLSLMAVAAPTYAQSNQTIDLSATVAGACGNGNHRSGSDAVFSGWSADTLTVNLTNAGNGQFNGQSFDNVSFGQSIWCNGPATITMNVSPLTTTNAVGDTGSFTNTFRVEMTSDMGVYFAQGEDYVFTSTVGGYSNPLPGAFETGTGRFGGADQVRVLADSANKRPVAGSYSGTITLTATSN
jgi:hypothetical protein